MNLLAAVIGMLCVVGCGGSGGSGGGAVTIGGTTPTAANVAPLIVDNGPPTVASSTTPAVNTLYTTVTICTPGTNTCETIDHIQVDTGSVGLRIIGSQVNISLPLEQGPNGESIAECTKFV